MIRKDDRPADLSELEERMISMGLEMYQTWDCQDCSDCHKSRVHLNVNMKMNHEERKGEASVYLPAP